MTSPRKVIDETLNKALHPPKGATHYRDDVPYPTYYIKAQNGLFYFDWEGNVKRSFSSWAEHQIKELSD